MSAEERRLLAGLLHGTTCRGPHLPHEPHPCRDLAAYLQSQGVSVPAEPGAPDPCNIEPAFSQHEYAVDYCETHDRPADQCASQPVPAPEPSAPCICTPDQFQGHGHGVNCPQYAPEPSARLREAAQEALAAWRAWRADEGWSLERETEAMARLDAALAATPQDPEP